MCDDCAGTHQRFNPNSPSFECRAIGATVECEVGRYFNVLTGQCDDCKPGTYADGFTTAKILDNTTTRVSDNKLRTTCTQCSSITKINGDGSFSKMAQTSPFGATSNAECFPKFQTANNGDAFCFGRGTLGEANSTAGVSKLALVQLKDNVDTNEADIGTVCQTASEGLGYTFTGIVYPPQGCFVNTETNEAAYYVRAADYLKDGLKNVNTTTDSKFAPICERFACISETDESSFLTEANLPDDELECRASIDAVNSAIAIEASIQINKFFPPVAVLIILIAIWAYNHYIKTHADLANHQDKEFIEKFLLLPRSVHYMVWWGLSLRLFDWATDWGFYGISLQSLTFEAACADGVTNMKALRSWSLFFNIVGTILTPIDIWGAHQRMILKGGEHSITWQRIVFAISALEDFPQLILNATFIATMYRYQQQVFGRLEEGEVSDLDAFEPISMFSLAASVANLVLNIVLLIQKRAERRIVQKVIKLEAELAEYKGRAVMNPVYGY